MENTKKFLMKYYRLSLEEKEKEESNSIRNQRNLIEYYIKEHKELKQYDSLEFVDDGYTGTNWNRPGIKAIFELIKKNQVACLIVKDFSRFSRDYIELGNYIEQIFPLMQIRFIAINDCYDSKEIEPTNYKLEIPLKGILNDFYSKDISKKVSTIKRQMIKQGKQVSGSYPYGYKKEKTSQTPYQIDKEAADVVKYIFSLALQGKKTIEIARELNRKKIKTPGLYKQEVYHLNYGMKEVNYVIWDSNKVRKIIQDERYTGTLILGRYKNTKVGSTKMIESLKETWYRRENAFPAIISMDEFRSIQELRRSYKEKNKKRKKHHLLYRKIKCSGCNCYLYHKPSSSGEKYNSFYCKKSHLDETSNCFTDYIKEKDILELIFILIQKHICLTDFIQNSILNEMYNLEKEKLQIETQIRFKQREKSSLYKQYRQKEITKVEFIQKNQEIQCVLEEKRQKVESYKNKTISEQITKETIIKIITKDKVQNIRRLFECFINMIYISEKGRIKILLNYRNF